MKPLDTTTVKPCNVNRVVTAYNNAKDMVMTIETYINNNNVSLREACQLLYPDLDYHFVYSVMKRWSDIPISSAINGKSKSAKIAYSNRRIFSKTDKDVVVSMYVDEKRTLKHISNEFGTNSVTVMQFLQECGVPRRTKSEIMTIRMASAEARENLRRHSTKNYLNKRKTGTKPEIEFKCWLDQNCISYEEQFRKVGNGHPYDFFIPHLNLIVEIDGFYWHQSDKQKIKDAKHVEDAIQQGYNIVRICTKELEESGNDYTKWIKI